MKSKSTEPEASPIIFDNTVLSNFALSQVFYVLQRLYAGRAFVGKAVQREIQAGINSASTSARLKNRQGSRELLARGIEQNWDSTPSERELLNRSRGLRPMLRSATR